MKVNYRTITEKVAKSEIGQRRIDSAIRKKFAVEKQILLDEFQQHAVSREITEAKDGRYVDNSSGTLPGSPGNLFGFIGFNLHENPVAKVYGVLQEFLNITTTGKQISDRKIKVRCSIKVPVEAVKAVSPLPFETGKSWVYGIEDGISGFGNFITGPRNNPPSFSTMGVQADNKVRGESFNTVPYLRKLLSDFAARLRGKN